MNTRLFTMLGCAVLLIVAGAALWRLRPDRSAATNAGTESTPTTSGRPSDRSISPEQARELAALEAREQGIEEGLWATEMLAQRYGRELERLWDRIKSAPESNRLSTLATLDAAEILGPAFAPGEGEASRHGVRIFRPAGEHASRSAAEWAAQVRESILGGWVLKQVEWRHVRFTPGADGVSPASEYTFSAQLGRALETAVLEGPVRVVWGELRPAGDGAAMARVDARGLTLRRRAGRSPFREVLSEFVQPKVNTSSIDPLLVRDLDGDGVSEVVLAVQNRVYRRQASGEWRGEPLCLKDPGLLTTAVLGDFDGDGQVDLLGMRHEGLRLCRGAAGGVYAGEWVEGWTPPVPLAYPMVLTCGDVDLDGDLDVYVAQYKVPYELGLMPTPFHNANDGHPAVLLLNDGAGRFRDGTEGAGLMAKRARRSYASSLVDLDADGRLDLVVVSDFAGIDLHRGDGRGRFEDVTAAWVDEPHAFGMGHTVSDFNADGRLDVLMMGMTSPTASRLEHLGLWREGLSEDRSLRARMTHGNRLYIGRAGGGFEERSAAMGIASSGWSWGCVALDADNDGYPDVYVTNGLESRESVQDYESHYWLHDAFVGGTNDNPTAYLYFMTQFSRTRGRGQSYGGYDKNRFFLNNGGGGFEEVGQLFGVGYEEDSRNVVADDLDRDGRVDLVVTSFEAWPQSKQRVRFLRNELEGTGNWVGFDVLGSAGAGTTEGAVVELVWAGRRVARTVTTGDSYRSQQAATVHFGLGTADSVDKAVVRWPGGEVQEIPAPAINRYHRVQRGATVAR